MSGRALVDQIKSLQRSDPAGKQAWWNYCDKHLGGNRDPNRHDDSTLSQFLSTHGGSSPAKGGWGGGKSGMGGMGAMMGGMGGMYGMGGMMGAFNPMMMMMAGGGKGGGMGMGGGGGGGLVGFVKQGQRSSAHWKAAWQGYCGLHGGGINDPVKHDESFIQGFIDYVGQLAEADLQTQGAPQGGMAPQGGTKRPGASLASPAKRSAAGGDSEKAALVEQVKSLQRSDPELKAAWWAFCDENAQGVKDPNRHETQSLEHFLSNYA